MVPATVYKCGIVNMSSNFFLSCLSSNFLNGLHFIISISDAIRYEGIVRPIRELSELINLKNSSLGGEGAYFLGTGEKDVTCTIAGHHHHNP